MKAAIERVRRKELVGEQRFEVTVVGTLYRSISSPACVVYLVDPIAFDPSMIVNRGLQCERYASRQEALDAGWVPELTPILRERRDEFTVSFDEVARGAYHFSR